MRIGILLAAGRGQRLRPLTDEKPKPLLSFKDHTFLGLTIEAALKANVEKFVIVVGYKQDHILSYVKDKYPDLDVQFVEQEQQQGSMDALVKALKFLAAEGVAYTDAVIAATDYVLDPEDLQDFLAKRQNPSEVFLYGNVIGSKEAAKSAIVHKTDTGRVQSLEEKPKNLTGEDWPVAKCIYAMPFEACNALAVSDVVYESIPETIMHVADKNDYGVAWLEMPELIDADIVYQSVYSEKR